MRQIKSQLNFLPDYCRSRAFELANKDIMCTLHAKVKTIGVSVGGGFEWDDIDFWWNIKEKLKGIEIRYKKDFVHIYQHGVVIMGTNFSNKKESLEWIRKQIEILINK